LAGTPRVIQESLLFPYLEGAGFVQALWSGGERVAPFGEYMPRSTEEVMNGSVSDPPVDLALDVGGGRLVDQDVLGRLAIDVLLEEHLGASAARGLADGWEGDRYALVELVDGRRGLVWYVLWEDAPSRDRFADAMDVARERFGGATTIARVEAAGLPATVLRVGPMTDVTVGVRVSDDR
jgi:hypothetical protein